MLFRRASSERRPSGLLCLPAKLALGLEEPLLDARRNRGIGRSVEVPLVVGDGFGEVVLLVMEPGDIVKNRWIRLQHISR